MTKFRRGAGPNPSFSPTGQSCASPLPPGHTAGEGRLTDKEPDEQRCKTGEEKDPHKDPDQDARLLFGRLLLSAG